MYTWASLVAQTVKSSACNAGDPGSIPGTGRSPGEGNGNPLQYSCLENSMDGGAWWATVHGVAESDTIEWFHFHFFSFHTLRVGFPGDTEVKKPPANAVNSLIPGSGRSSGGGNGNPLQYSYLENPMGRGACGLLSVGLQNSWTWLGE